MGPSDGRATDWGLLPVCTADNRTIAGYEVVTVLLTQHVEYSRNAIADIELGVRLPSGKRQPARFVEVFEPRVPVPAVDAVTTGRITPFVT